MRPGVGDDAVPAAPRLEMHGRRQLIVSGYVLTLSTVSATVLGALFWAVAALRYHAGDVGYASAFAAGATFASGVGSAGVGHAYQRFVPRIGHAWPRLVRGGYLASLTAINAGIIAYFGITHLLPGIAPEWNPGTWVLFALCASFWTLFSLQDVVLTTLQRPWPIFLENLLTGLARFPLLWTGFGGGGATSVILAWIVPAAVAVVLVSVFTLRRKMQWTMPAVARLPTAGDVARFGWRAALGAVAGTITLTAMPVFVAHGLGRLEAARFLMPWSAATGLLALGAAMVSPYTAAVARGLGDEERETTHRVIMHVLAIVTTSAVAGVALAVAVLGRAFGRSYDVDAVFMSTLLAGSVVGCVGAVFLGRLVALGHSGRASLARISGAAVILCAPLFMAAAGLLGSALAFVAGQTMTAAAAIALSRNEAGRRREERG